MRWDAFDSRMPCQCEMKSSFLIVSHERHATAMLQKNIGLSSSISTPSVFFGRCRQNEVEVCLVEFHNCPQVYGARAVSKTAGSEPSGLGSTPRWASNNNYSRMWRMVIHPTVNRALRAWRFDPVSSSQISAMTALRQSIVLNSQLYA